MTNKQENKTTMADVVDQQMTELDSVILAKMHGMDDQIHDLGISLGLLKKQGSIQTVDQTGNAEQKEEFKNAMVDSAMQLVNRGKAYAMDINDVVLIKKMSFKKASLARKSDSACPKICKAIYDNCHALQTELIVFGATAEMFTDLDAKMTSYNDVAPDTRSAITDKKVVTKNIAKYLAQVEGILKRMDVLVMMLEISDPDFVSTYFNNRKVIDTGKRKQCLRVFVCDAAGNGLGRVTVTIGRGSDAFVKKTTAKGNFIVKNLLNAVYPATFSKPGFKDFTTEFAVTVGERTVIRVALEPLATTTYTSRTA